jgi:hypothetical protein
MKIDPLSNIRHDTSVIGALGQNQRDRLAFVDFRLFFLGTVSRAHICERFGIAPAAATRDFSLYRKLAPNNLMLNGTTKQYWPTENFAPLFEHPLDRVLATLSTGHVEKVDVNGEKLFFPCEVSPSINRPDIIVLASVTRAISLGQAVLVTYHSNSSGLMRREIVPFALVDSGLRWHVRAYDRSNREFRDFVLTRMSDPEISASSPEKHEQAAADMQWSRIVELELVPHPFCLQPKIVEKDFSMSQGVLKLTMRAAVAGYVLRRWSVDCSPTGSLSGPEFSLWLKNPLSLYGVASAALAPGFLSLLEVSK